MGDSSKIRSRSIALLLAISPLLLTAAFQGLPTLQYAEVTEDGVPVMVTRGRIDARRIAFTVEEVLRLRENPAREESFLQSPVLFVLGEEGSYYVLDAGRGAAEQRVAVFGPDGRFRRSFGRRGAGPGEFEAMSLVRLKDGILTLYDGNQRRTTRYRTDGTLLDVVTVPTQTRPRSYLMLADGRSLSWHVRASEGDGTRHEAAEVNILGAEDTEPAVVTTGTAPVAQQQSRTGAIGVRETVVVPMTFTGHPTILLAPSDELVAAEGDMPELAWYDAQGRLLRRARIEGQDRSFGKAMQQLYLSGLVAYERARAREQGREERPVEAPAHADVVGFSGSRGTVDEYGYVWLQGVWGPGEEGPEPGTYVAGPRTQSIWHVFAPDGRYLGVCRIPGTGAVTIMRGFALSLLWEEEAGLQIPAVFRIVPAIPGLEYPPMKPLLDP